MDFTDSRDRRLRRWFIDGEHNGRVDVADRDGDVLSGVTREHAETIIAARDVVLNELLTLKPELKYWIDK